MSAPLPPEMLEDVVTHPGSHGRNVLALALEQLAATVKRLRGQGADEVQGWVVVTFGGGGPEQCALPRCPIGALYFRRFDDARSAAFELEAFEPHVLPILDMAAAGARLPDGPATMPPGGPGARTPGGHDDMSP